jgi:N-acetylneuraminic acid mutarotase
MSIRFYTLVEFSFYFILINCIAFTAFSQNSWVQKPDLPGPGRFDAASFAIGNSAYITCGDTLNTGNDYLNDLWKWDQQNNTWTQMADFPGIPRRNCFSFAIGNNGYLGGGQNVAFPNLLDFWEYSSINNTWIQKSNAPGLQHDKTIGFSINQHGYIVFAGGDSVLHKYDPLLDQWNLVNYLPFKVRGGAVVFVVGNNSYIGIGAWEKDFWKYDAITENWMQITDYPGPKRTAATAFSIYGFGYVGCGYDTYDTLNNQWSGVANFPAGGNTEAVGFAINGKGYLCTGAPPFPPAANYLWEYSPIVGIAEENNTNLFNVFPNPFHTSLNVSVNYSNNSKLFFNLFNASGNLLKNIEFSSSELSIESNTITSGLYFYSITDQRNYLLDSGKLIKTINNN